MVNDDDCIHRLDCFSFGARARKRNNRRVCMISEVSALARSNKERQGARVTVHRSGSSVSFAHYRSLRHPFVTAFVLSCIRRCLDASIPGCIVYRASNVLGALGSSLSVSLSQQADVDRVFELMDEMYSKKLQPDVMLYSSAISCCGKVGCCPAFFCGYRRFILPSEKVRITVLYCREEQIAMNLAIGVV